jgi:hypothetical protein
VETLRPLSLSLMAPVVYEPGKGGGGGHPIPYPVSYHPAPYVEPFGYRAQHPSMVFPSHAHAQHHHQHAHHHQHQHPLRRQQVMVSPPGPVMHSSAHGGMINAAGPSPLMVLGWAANSARHPGSAPSYPDAHAYSSSSSGGSSRSGSSAALSNGGGGPAPSLILGEGMGLSRARIDETSSTASSGSSAREGTSQVSAPKKRLRLSSEERLQRSRERNRVHARKTRKRKKIQMESIQTTIETLQEEGRRMRLAIMEWYTANLLLVMRGPENGSNPDAALLDKYTEVQSFLERTSSSASSKAMLGRSSGDEVKSELGASDDEEVVKGPRSRCKYAPEDRERIRRERNRIHAKRTRDRRKKFMEDSEKVLNSLTEENDDLRRVLDLIYDTPEDQDSLHDDGDDDEDTAGEMDDSNLKAPVSASQPAGTCGPMLAERPFPKRPKSE